MLVFSMGQNIITANIRFDNSADNADSWPNRRELFSQTLLSHSPLLIATQEGREPQLLDLHSLLDGYTLISQNRNWIEQRMYPCLFLKESLWEIHDSGDKWLSLTPDIAGSSSFESAFPRLFTWVHATLRSNNEKYLIINTHLDHILESTRLSQVEVLATELLKLVQNDEKIIILGDFNDSPQSEVRSHLISLLPFLSDPWIELNMKEETSFHPFTGVNPDGFRIDWILVDKRIEYKKIELDKSERSGKYPSDHFPVVCEINF